MLAAECSIEVNSNKMINKKDRHASLIEASRSFSCYPFYRLVRSPFIAFIFLEKGIEITRRSCSRIQGSMAAS